MRSDDTTLLIELADMGRGIPKDKIANLFTFGRQSNRGDASLGLGIGLALVEKACVSIFHAVPEIESELGVGTTICFKVDLATEVTPTERPRT